MVIHQKALRKLITSRSVPRDGKQPQKTTVKSEMSGGEMSAKSTSKTPQKKEKARVGRVITGEAARAAALKALPQVGTSKKT